MKSSLSHATVTSVLLYDGTTRSISSKLWRRFGGAYARTLRVALNVTRRDRLTNGRLHQTWSKSVARLAGHCWKSWRRNCGRVHKERAIRERQAETEINQICDDTSCNRPDLPNMVNNRSGWRKRELLEPVRPDDDDDEQEDDEDDDDTFLLLINLYPPTLK